MSEELLRLAVRLQRLAESGGDSGRFSWRRLLGRLRRTSATPSIATARLTMLVDRIEYGYASHLHPRQLTGRQRKEKIADLHRRAERAEPTDRVFAGAVRELTRNVARAERTALVHGRLPDGHVDRLWRLYQVAYRAAEWLEQPARRSSLRELICADARCALEPLTTDAAFGEARPIRGIDALITAAGAEVRFIGRQRRLLEAARQQLLDAGAAVRLSPAAARARRNLVARRIARLDRFEAAGVLPDVDIGYQAREAMERRELPRLFAAVVALEGSAFAAGDETLRRLVEQAATSLCRTPVDRGSAPWRADSLRASQEQLFGSRLRELIDRAYQVALTRLEALRSSKHADPGNEDFFYDDEFFSDWERYLTAGSTQATLAGAVAADGCFDVGATSSPVRGPREALRPTLVPFPQQQMAFEPVGGVEDIPNAIIGDPRRVLLDLAAGKLLARRYVGYLPHRGGEQRLRNEVRVYVLDGSSSMLGPRARMRDALLLAELSTVAARLQDPRRPGNPVLYYRYFNDEIGETQRVAAIEDTETAVENVLGSVHEGGTNIQGALLASFEQIRLARVGDPDLARGQIVLVTDGEASIDEKALRTAREGVGDIPVGVSIIALGTENPDLRKLAAHQRARGERVFYQFVDDDELWSIVEGETAGLPLHLPSGAGPELLNDELRAVVADIERHLRRIDVDELARAKEISEALSELGLAPAAALDQRGRVRIAAAENDRLTLEDAFLRAFPAPPEASPAADVAPTQPMAEGPHTPDILTALTTVAEIVETFGNQAAERQADAIELIERLLAEACVPPWEYASLVLRPPVAVKEALTAVHAAARFRR